MTTSLKTRLLESTLDLDESDFGTHESDLHVLERPDGISVINWLIVNYEHMDNITIFIGAEGSDWAGKLAYDIPFAK